MGLYASRFDQTIINIIASKYVFHNIALDSTPNWAWNKYAEMCIEFTSHWKQKHTYTYTQKALAP